MFAAAPCRRVAAGSAVNSDTHRARTTSAVIRATPAIRGSSGRPRSRRCEGRRRLNRMRDPGGCSCTIGGGGGRARGRAPRQRRERQHDSRRRRHAASAVTHTRITTCRHGISSWPAPPVPSPRRWRARGRFVPHQTKNPLPPPGRPGEGGSKGDLRNAAAERYRRRYRRYPPMARKAASRSWAMTGRAGTAMSQRLKLTELVCMLPTIPKSVSISGEP